MEMSSKSAEFDGWPSRTAAESMCSADEWGERVLWASVVSSTKRLLRQIAEKCAEMERKAFRIARNLARIER
jgi:hypothetical protein